MDYKSNKLKLNTQTNKLPGETNPIPQYNPSASVMQNQTKAPVYRRSRIPAPSVGGDTQINLPQPVTGSNQVSTQANNIGNTGVDTALLNQQPVSTPNYQNFKNQNRQEVISNNPISSGVNQIIIPADMQDHFKQYSQAPIEEYNVVTPEPMKMDTYSSTVEAKFGGFDSQEEWDNAKELNITSPDEYYQVSGGPSLDFNQQGFENSPFATSAKEGIENTERDIMINQKMLMDKAGTDAVRAGLQPGSPEYESMMRDAQNRGAQYAQDARNQASSLYRESMLDYNDQSRGDAKEVRNKLWDIRDEKTARDFQKEWYDYTSEKEWNKADSDRMLDQAKDNPFIFKELNMARAQGKNVAEVYASLFEKDASGVFQLNKAYQLPTEFKKAYNGYVDIAEERKSVSGSYGKNPETGEEFETAQDYAMWKSETGLDSENKATSDIKAELAIEQSITKALSDRNSGKDWTMDMSIEAIEAIENQEMTDKFADLNIADLKAKYDDFDGMSADENEKAIKKWLKDGGVVEGAIVEKDGKLYKVTESVIDVDNENWSIFNPWTREWVVSVKAVPLTNPNKSPVSIKSERFDY